MTDREALYKAVIGPRNQDYYVRHFARFDAAGKAGISWNWPAALLSFFWFLYRRMWAFGIAYLVLANVVAGLFALLFGDNGRWLGLIAQFALPGMFGNALYYRHCTRKIAEAEAASGDPQNQLGRLEASGGTGRGGLIVVLVLFGITVLGMLAAVAIPQYQLYVTRAKLEEAAQLGRAAVDAVETYRQQNGRFPEHVADAGATQALPPFVYSLDMDGNAVVVTIRQGNGFADGGNLRWETGDAVGGWRCSARRLKAEALPQDCR